MWIILLSICGAMLAYFSDDGDDYDDHDGEMPPRMVW